MKKYIDPASKFCLIYTLPLILILCLIPAITSADEFDDMKAEMDGFSANSEQVEFDQYRDQIDAEFKSYKAIIDQEYKKFRDEILEYWSTPEMTGMKKFVEYTPDKKIKKVVDFEKEEVVISIIKPEGTPDKKIQETLKKQLKDLITETNVKALERDTFSQNVEKKVKKAVKDIKTDTVKSVPIITDVVTGTSKPSKKQVDNAADDMLRKGKIEKTPADKVPGEQIVSIKVKLPGGAMQTKAAKYLDSVKKYSAKRNVDPALVLAVMQTESAFNPMARSYVPAYGLMQIVPRSAGLDASKEVLGKQVVLSPSYLYNGDNNIQMGAAYLYILNYRYLKKIKNDQSRLYCVIAAYNTGAGNVARAFTGKTNISTAAKKINSMTPDEVYYHLIKKLPHNETRRYVKNVTNRMALYR